MMISVTYLCPKSVRKACKPIYWMVECRMRLECSDGPPNGPDVTPNGPDGPPNGPDGGAGSGRGT